jgi:hypothetical protein
MAASCERAMFLPYLTAAVVVGLTVLACVIAFPACRAAPIRRWRLAIAPLLLLAACLLVLRQPPFNDLLEPEVWMVGLPLAVVGGGRGALIGLQVDHGQGILLLKRAPEEFWITVVALLLIVVDIAEEPIGVLGRLRAGCRACARGAIELSGGAQCGASGAQS